MLIHRHTNKVDICIITMSITNANTATLQLDCKTIDQYNTSSRWNGMECAASMLWLFNKELKWILTNALTFNSGSINESSERAHLRKGSKRKHANCNVALGVLWGKMFALITHARWSNKAKSNCGMACLLCVDV